MSPHVTLMSPMAPLGCTVTRLGWVEGGGKALVCPHPSGSDLGCVVSGWRLYNDAKECYTFTTDA